MGLEFWLTGYVVIGVFLLLFGLIGLMVCASSGDDVSVAARFVVLSFVWPIVLAYWLGLLIWWIWKSADLV